MLPGNRKTHLEVKSNYTLRYQTFLPPWDKINAFDQDFDPAWESRITVFTMK